MAKQPFPPHQQPRRHTALGALLYSLVLIISLPWGGAPAGHVHVLMGAYGPVQPPPAALQASGEQSTGVRALGLARSAIHVSPRAQMSAAPLDASAAPPGADLTPYSPPVGNQGEIASCVAWVTAYYMLGWYARRDGYYPAGGPDGAGSFAPMYVYSQLTQGKNIGTTFGDTLDLEMAQGMDTRADYTPGDQDYTTQPTEQQHANAAAYKLAGYTTLFVGANQGDPAQQMIEAALAGGNPVGIGLSIYDNFWNADAAHYYIDTSNVGASHGNHAVVAFKYDANGLWVENQWGTGWGLNGWVELSWDYVKQYVWQAVTIRPGAPPVAAATAPPSSTPTTTPSTNTATSTETVSATSTPTAMDTVTGTTNAATITDTAVISPSNTPVVSPTTTPPASRHTSRPAHWRRRPHIVRAQPMMRWQHTAESSMRRPARYSEVPLSYGRSGPHQRHRSRLRNPTMWPVSRHVA